MQSKKRMGMLLVGLCMVTSIYAQDTNETKTLFGKKEWNPLKKVNYLGLYVAPELHYGRLAGGFTPMGGISTMLQINKKWGIGGVVYTTFGGYTPTQLSSTKAYNFDAGFGGLKLEYTVKPNSMIHVSFPLIIGAGMARINSAGRKRGKWDLFGEKGMKGEGVHSDWDRGGRRDGMSDNLFFMIQPGINLEMNVLKYAKVFLGASYRITAGKSKATSTNPLLIPTSSQISGFYMNAGIKVGLFDYNIGKKKAVKEN